MSNSNYCKQLKVYVPDKIKVMIVPEGNIAYPIDICTQGRFTHANFIGKLAIPTYIGLVWFGFMAYQPL